MRSIPWPRAPAALLHRAVPRDLDRRISDPSANGRLGSRPSGTLLIAARCGLWRSDRDVDLKVRRSILDELDLIPIEPLPPWVWYRDMVDFAEGISDSRAGRRISRISAGTAIGGTLHPAERVSVRGPWTSTSSGSLAGEELSAPGSQASSTERLR
jgi:hypothetical protein